MDRISHLYAGTARGMGGTGRGLYRLALGDGLWQPLSNGLPEDAGVHALAVHPQDPATLYAGTTRGLFRIFALILARRAPWRNS